MLEGGLQFTRRRLRIARRPPDHPFLCELSSAQQPDEASTKSVDFAKDQ
jgi:hypothetical protein